MLPTPRKLAPRTLPIPHAFGSPKTSETDWMGRGQNAERRMQNVANTRNVEQALILILRQFSFAGICHVRHSDVWHSDPFPFGQAVYAA